MLKKRYLFLIIIICLFTISTVSAEDNATSNIISEGNNVNSLEANSNMNSIANDTNTLKASNDDILTAGNNWYVNSSKTSSGDGKSEAGAFKTLNESLTVAQNGDTVMIASGTYSGNDNLNLTIAKRLNFIKYGDGEAIFDAESQSRIWRVTATLTNITGLTFKNGKANGVSLEEKWGGAIIWNGANGTVSKCNFINNTANNNGGAIYWYCDNGTVSGCNFTNNTANNDGGAICWFGSYGAVSGCNFTNNTANYGGAIRWYGSYGAVSGCNFTNNTANYGGGAICWYSSYGAVSGCNFTNNTANSNGGAIYWYGANGTVSGCTFINNAANMGGGAISVQNANLNVTKCAIVNNIAPIGSEIYIDGGNVNLNYNWWGSNNPNWANLINRSYEPSVFAVLNITADPSEINACEKSTITTKFVWNGTNTDVTNSLPKRNVKLTTNGTLTEIEGTVGLTSQFSVTTGGIYYVNGTVDNEILGINVKVNLIPTNITVTNITVNTTSLDLTLGENGTINATLNPPEAGNLTVNYDDKIITVTQNTAGILYVTPKAEGNTTITFSFSGNEQYAPAVSKNITVTVNRIPTEINITNATVTLNVTDSVSSGASLTPASAGGLTYTSSNSTVAVVEDGMIRGLKEGTAIITVSFAGNERYAAAESKTIIVTVNEKPIPPKENLTISASAQPITVGEDANVIVIGLKDATGNVTVTVNGKTYTAPIKNSEATVIVSGLTETVIASVNYSGDNKYNPASTTVNITVNPKPKENLTISASAQPITVGEDANVIVIGLKDATGNVTVTVNNKKYTAPINDGNASVIVSDLPVGKFTAIVTYAGDDNYNPVNTTVDIIVYPKSDVIILAENITKYYGGPESFIVKIYDSKNKKPIANKTVKITINGITYNKTTNAKGIASLAIRLSNGTYNVTTTVDNTTVKSQVTVLSTIIGLDLTKYYKNQTQYSVKVYDDTEGKPVGKNEIVTFNVNGIFYKRTTDENGIATLNINLPPSDYIITADYKGCKISNKIKVLPVLNAEDIIMNYLDGTQFKANLVDGQGKPYKNQMVTFNVNGVFYNRLTDSNGQAALNIRLPVGEYIITSSFNGCNIANKITITS